MSASSQKATEEVFWASRFSRNGHTGWSNPVVYAFDQRERVHLIRKKLEEMRIPAGVALDFGCGTGDFSKLLLKMGYAVHGYYPYVKPLIRSEKFLYSDNLDGIRIPPGTARLAIAVTVLDHILDENAALDALRVIRSHLSDDGVFLMMEYAVSTDSLADEMRGNSYQAFRTISTWKRLLEASKFKVERILPVPHPVNCPSAGFLVYKQSLLMRILRKARTFGLPEWVFGSIRNVYISFILRNGPDSISGQGSPLNLFICKMA